MYRASGENYSDNTTTTTYFNYDATDGYYNYSKSVGTVGAASGNYIIYSQYCNYVYGILGSGHVKSQATYYKLNNATYEESQTWIDKNYYVYNTTLKSITIPDSVTYIMDYAFAYCQNLSEINGGKNVITIGYSAFTVAEQINLNYSDNYTYCDYTVDNNGNLKVSAINTDRTFYFYNGDSARFLYSMYNEKTDTYSEVSVYDETTCTDTYYWTGIYNLEPYTDLMIHTRNVSGLTKEALTFPEFSKLQTICSSAFYQRENLWDVVLSDTVTYINPYAFYECNLTSITLCNPKVKINYNVASSLEKKYETLGTNKGDEYTKTIIYTRPDATNVLAYGRTWSEDYRLKAGYTITYYSNNGEENEPSYDFMVLYENYMRCQNVKKVAAFLMETIEKEYPEEAEKEQDKLPEAYVETVPVEGDEDVGNVYFLAEDNMQYGVPDLLKQNDILGSIAEKENANLQMISCGDNAVMAIPVETLEEYAENLDVLAELYQLEQEKEAESQIYDRSRNVLVKDPEEIKELLLKGKVKKKGIFSR